ncbi:MAG: hypothetical protein BWY26_01179 [Elusimicrobia bacterium ADurb.Bin231]|nr:MAG: hypothetical protein BWY26_01179 [Elusimicrobia bacterium ADurb.Bin231]
MNIKKYFGLPRKVNNFGTTIFFGDYIGREIKPFFTFIEDNAVGADYDVFAFFQFGVGIVKKYDLF